MSPSARELARDCVARLARAGREVVAPATGGVGLAILVGFDNPLMTAESAK